MKKQPQPCEIHRLRDHFYLTLILSIVKPAQMNAHTADISVLHFLPLQNSNFIPNISLLFFFFRCLVITALRIISLPTAYKQGTS